MTATLVPTSATYSLFQPVRATLLLENSTQEELVASVNLRKSLRLTVEEPDGTTVHVGPPPSAGGIWVPVELVVPAGGELRRSVLLNDWLTFPVPGDYRVGVHLVESTSGQPDGLLAAEGPPCTIRVLPADPAALDRECERLAQEAIQPSSQRASDAARALSYIHHEVCLDDLERVLEQSYHGKADAVRGLAQLGTAEAAAVLVGIWDRLRWDLQAVAFAEFEQAGRRDKLEAMLAEAGKEVKPAWSDGDGIHEGDGER